MGIFRLYHLSDLHFSADAQRLGHPYIPSSLRKTLGVVKGSARDFATSHDPEIAEQLARFLFLTRDDYEIVIYTGDLATTGTNEDLRGSKQLVCRPFPEPVDNEEIPYLNCTGRDLLLLPGNHDRYVGNTGKSGGTVFDEVYDGYWESGTRVQVPKVYDRDDGTKLFIIRADLTLKAGDKAGPPPFGYLGQGRVSQHVCDGLVAATDAIHKKCAGPGFGIIWALHFNPLCKHIGWELLNEGLLRNTLATKKYKICAILCGHSHISKFSFYTGYPLCVSGSTISAVKNERSLNSITINVNVDPEIRIQCSGTTLTHDMDKGLFVPSGKTVEWQV